MNDPGESAAKAALLFVGIAAFNAYRRGQLAQWTRAKFFNAASSPSPNGLTTADVFTAGLDRMPTTIAPTDSIGGAVGGAIGGAGSGAGGVLVNVAGVGKLSSAFSAKWIPMADAAKADGVILTGTGWRSNQRQIELRIAHGCGGSRIYDRTCKGSPPTAVPGRSRHETGDAVDVKLTGAGGRNSPEYRWLTRNAARFGVHNLPSEPWHWSTDGK